MEYDMKKQEVHPSSTMSQVRTSNVTSEGTGGRELGGRSSMGSARRLGRKCDSQLRFWESENLGENFAALHNITVF